MPDTISIDGAGRLVLPVAVRRRLGIEAGSRLHVSVVAESIQLTPESDAGIELVLSPGRRRVLKPTGTAFDAAAAVRAERDRHAKGKRRG